MLVMAQTANMAFVKHPVYHTPDWYEEHCTEEDGGSPMFRFMLKNDMAFIGADNDPHANYQEKAHIYREKWDSIFANWRAEDPNGVQTGEMLGAREREALKDYRAKDNNGHQTEAPQVENEVRPAEAARAELRRRIFRRRLPE